MTRKRQEPLWQSFADLGMGLMAVFMLVVVVLVQQTLAEAEESKTKAEELTEFALLLVDAMDSSAQLQSRQEAATGWVEHVFTETNCALSYDPRTGQLRPKATARAELYQPGDVRLSREARRQLASCQTAFMRIAQCLTPHDATLGRPDPCPDARDPKWSGPAKAFRDGIEALVLQGNTDRVPYKRAGRIRDLDGKLPELQGDFADNAFLGAERARQALGHLLFLVSASEADAAAAEYDPSHVLMSRLRLESASFGRYQVGPVAQRDAAAATCSDDDRSCDAARNLALRLRWRQRSLRKPFDTLVGKFCEHWAEPGSEIRQIIHARGQDARVAALCTRDDGE